MVESKGGGGGNAHENPHPVFAQKSGWFIWAARTSTVNVAVANRANMPLNRMPSTMALAIPVHARADNSR